MNGVYLLIGTFFIIAVILITVVLVMINKYKHKVIRKEVEQLDKEKNLIASTPVYSKRVEVIKEEKINQINDMINELDMSTTTKDYKNINQKIAKVEMEVYKVRESANELLNEIKEITVSEEKYRSIGTRLKAKNRKLIS